MTLIISNISEQIVDFQYRLPGSVGLRTESIPAGGALEIRGNRNELDAIVEHHCRYGFAPAQEAANLRGVFGALVYSVQTASPEESP